MFDLIRHAIFVDGNIVCLSYYSFIFQPEVDLELGALSWSFFKQGWLKEALTEGELYLMNFFPLISLAQQGVYQVSPALSSWIKLYLFSTIAKAP